MQDEVRLLDEIHLTNDSVIHGIIDYRHKKFTHFFDVGKEDDPNITLLVLIWRVGYSDMRFSVFCNMYYPSFDLPPVKLIHHSNIKEANIETKIKEETVKKKKFSVKKSKAS